MAGEERDDIVQGCVKWLMNNNWTPGFDPSCHTPFRENVITDFPPLGHFPGLAPYTYYLFQDHMYTNLEGTGDNAVVISDAGGWGAPNPYNTLQLPRLQVELFCDPLRHADDPVASQTSFRRTATSASSSVVTAHAREPAETRRRLKKLYERFDRYLHRPQGGVQWWGTVRTIGCVRLGDLTYAPVSDGGGMLRGVVYYGVLVA